MGTCNETCIHFSLGYSKVMSVKKILLYAEHTEVLLDTKYDSKEYKKRTCRWNWGARFPCLRGSVTNRHKMKRKAYRKVRRYNTDCHQATLDILTYTTQYMYTHKKITTISNDPMMLSGGNQIRILPEIMHCNVQWWSKAESLYHLDKSIRSVTQLLISTVLNSAFDGAAFSHRLCVAYHFHSRSRAHTKRFSHENKIRPSFSTHGLQDSTGQRTCREYASRGVRRRRWIRSSSHRSQHQKDSSPATLSRYTFHLQPGKPNFTYFCLITSFLSHFLYTRDIEEGFEPSSTELHPILVVN